MREHSFAATSPVPLAPRSVRVSLFATCLGDHVFADAVADAARLLRALGVEVMVPPRATCCGQPAWNSGYADDARRVAAHTVRVLGGEEPVVTPSGSCAAMLRKVYPTLLEGTPEADGALALSRRTRELSEFIVERFGTGLAEGGLVDRTVAYHHGCHAMRELGIREQPLDLLTAAGAEVVSWVAADECCGFGGTFSVKLPHVSVGMADRKLDTLPACDVLTSADGGCLMQLSGRARARGMPIQVRHLASLLWEGVNGPS